MKSPFSRESFPPPRASPRAPLPPGARAWGRPARPAPPPLESASPGGAGRALGSPRYRELPLGLASAWLCGHAWGWVTGSEDWLSGDWYKRYRTGKRLGARSERLVQTL